jgi:16S rRNA (uracil1498-N3)-methyltransferase
MNLLLFEQDELDGNLLRVAGRRAEHILNVLGLREGDTLKAGMVNGETGTARVIGITPQEVDLEVHLTAMPPEGPLIELILALPRPIMLQRILKQATVLGVRRFHLIRSFRVQKSFFQASLLQPDKLKELLLQGLEQTIDTRLPEVRLHNRFKPFVEETVPTLKSSCRLLAHPDTSATLSDLFSAGKISGGVTLAIGPEGGWIPHEIDQLVKQGFECFSMGRRILHVDTAVVALLAQLLLLVDLQAFSAETL